MWYNAYRIIYNTYKIPIVSIFSKIYVWFLHFIYSLYVYWLAVVA